MKIYENNNKIKCCYYYFLKFIVLDKIMEKEKNKNGFWNNVIGIVIVIGFIWLLFTSDGNGFGCYEDKYGEEVCHENPRS